ncbi:MAG: LPS export ABC transporter periplasmic protein LptC [Deltaproteobacteria bacterium]|jgi:LPS export ABC transporter protein LptC|nr:LPS export ABC transporter periplasmic protein LptC [Deltaproteobacteria bacterium]
MKLIKNTYQKKLKVFLISLIFLTFGVIIIAFLQYLHVLEKNDTPVSTEQSQANISIGKAHQTATRNGRKEWSLEAASADYMNENNQAIFKDLSVTFYLKDETKVYITANQGILKTDSNDMEIYGNVVVKNEDYKLICENLHYKHDNRIIFSKVPVNITGNSFELVADSMSLNLNTNKAFFEGKVKGIFSGLFTL